MLDLVTHPDTVAIETRRHEWIDRAMRDQAIAMGRTTGAGLERLSLAEQRHGRDAIAGMWAIRGIAAVESVDPLGVCPWKHPRQPLSWPAWRTLLDWAAWSLLCLLALVYETVR